MSSIVLAVTVSQTPYPIQPPVNLFASIMYAVTDNSGASLTGTLNGTETPTPWSVTLSGIDGPDEATVTLQAVDSAGINLGSPLTVTESGTGGQPQTFPAPTSATLTVTG
jgi:hypothetical protein